MGSPRHLQSPKWRGARLTIHQEPDLLCRGSLLEKTGSYRRPVDGEVSVIAGLLHGPAEAMALIDCLWADYSNPDSAPDLEPEPEVGISTM